MILYVCYKSNVCKTMDIDVKLLRDQHVGNTFKPSQLLPMSVLHNDSTHLMLLPAARRSGFDVRSMLAHVAGLDDV